MNGEVKADFPWKFTATRPEEERIWEIFLSRGLLTGGSGGPDQKPRAGNIPAEKVGPNIAGSKHKTHKPGDRPQALKITCVRERTRELMDTPAGITEEGYRLSLGETVRITYASPRGLYYGLTALAELCNSGTLQEDSRRRFSGQEPPRRELFDFPRFPIRGIIEGFYGPPWSHEVRKEMVRFLPEIRMNSFFYGPKDDPWHRDKWREPYPQKELERLAELQNISAEQDTLFWYGLGPGLSIRYSGREELDLLTAKFSQIYKLGVRHFGLFLDDIPGNLLHREDREDYADLASAHISLINGLYRSLKSLDQEIVLAVCPTEYWGRPGYYISRLGAETDPRIHIFSTGPEICSRELTLRDASELERAIHRPVLYWDNYPVNDCAMSHRLHIGPYNNRDKHLYRASEGVIANGMEHAEASKIAFYTIGEYLWDPEGYDPDSSIKRAVRRVAGARDSAEFMPFLENNLSSCLADDKPTALRTALETCAFHLKREEPAEAREILLSEHSRLKKAVHLFKRGMENTALAKEIHPWSEKYILGVDIVGCMIEIIEYLACGAGLNASAQVHSPEGSTAGDVGPAGAQKNAGERSGAGKECSAGTSFTDRLRHFEDLSKEFLSAPGYVFSDVLPAGIAEMRKLLKKEP